jgi:hypothetical protein
MKDGINDLIPEQTYQELTHLPQLAVNKRRHLDNRKQKAERFQ